MLNFTRLPAIRVTTGQRATRVTVSPSMIRRSVVSSRQVSLDLCVKDSIRSLIFPILFHSSKLFLLWWQNGCGKVQDAGRNVGSGRSFNIGDRDDSVLRDLQASKRKDTFRYNYGTIPWRDTRGKICTIRCVAEERNSG